MLARSARPPASGDFAYEVKRDGFRAILSTEGPLPVRSRRGWNMTEHLQFLVHIPVRVVLDGELVAFDEDGKPDFPLVYERVLHGALDDRADLHRVRRPERRGRDMTREAYSERRRILVEKQLSGVLAHTEAFDDGAALRQAVCEHELEGVVVKRRSSCYLSGERGWVKLKNREYWRYELEREGTIRGRRTVTSIRKSKP